MYLQGAAAGMSRQRRSMSGLSSTTAEFRIDLTRRSIVTICSACLAPTNQQPPRSPVRFFSGKNSTKDTEVSDNVSLATLVFDRLEVLPSERNPGQRIRTLTTVRSTHQPVAGSRPVRYTLELRCAAYGAAFGGSKTQALGWHSCCAVRCAA